MKGPLPIVCRVELERFARPPSLLGVAAIVVVVVVSYVSLLPSLALRGQSMCDGSDKASAATAHERGHYSDRKLSLDLDIFVCLCLF